MNYQFIFKQFKRIAIPAMLAFSVMAGALPAGAATVAELQSEIAALQQQLAALQTQQTGTVPSACVGITFTRNLHIGMAGSDVKCLQALLNTSADTQVAVTGYGSPGRETVYFGPLTRNAVIKFQDKYAAQVLTPWGLTHGTGYVGSTTRAQLNLLLSSGTTPPPSGDTTPPTVSITSPVNGAVLTGTTTLSANAADNVGVAGVQFKVDGTSVGTEDTTSPYSISWNSATVGNGSHTITATARDTSGNLATSSAITVTTNNQNVVPPPTSAGLTVSVAADNPPTATIVNGQAQAHLLNLVFANGDNSSVTVTKLVLHRIGISSDTTLQNVYLFNGAQRLTDAASVSSGTVTFSNPNGLFTIPANTSMEITAEADIAGTTGETVGLALASAGDVSTGTTTVKGNFPINGNLMTIASVNLANVSFSSTITPNTATINPQNNYNVWQGTLSVSNHAVQLKRISLREIGTVNYTDLQNFRLYVDGVQQGAAVQNLDANGYVTFDLMASPITLQPGTHNIALWADIIGGSARNFSFSLRSPADITVTDTQYNANVLVQVNNTTFTPLSSGVQTISAGTISLSKAADSPSGNIVKGSSNAVLARYTVTAAGEPVKIQTLRASAISSNACTSLSNGAIFTNGVQVGSTANLNTTNNATPYTTFNLGSALTVTPGTPTTLEIRADVLCNDGTHTLANGDTIQAQLNSMTGTSNAQGTVSFTVLDVPTTTVQGNQLTVAAGALTLAQYTAYPNQTFVPPVTNTKLADFTLTANTTENVNLSNIQVNLTNISPSNVHNLYVTYDSQTTNTMPTVSSTNNFPINYQLAAGQTIHVMVYGDVDSGFTGNNAHFDVLVSGTTASSGTYITTNGGTAVTGQTLNFSNTGTFSAALDPSSPDAQITAGNKTVTAASYKFTAVNDDFRINEVKIAPPSAAASSVIQSATLRNGSTVLATVPYNGTNFDFTGLNVLVPRNTSTSLSLDYNLATPSATNGTDQMNVQPTLSSVTYFNSQGVQSTITPSVAAKTLIVYKSIPTVTGQTMTSTSLINGASTEVSRFSVSADPAGPIAIKQFKEQFIISNPTGGAPTLSNFRLFRGSQDITSQVSIESSAGTDLTGANTIGAGTSTVVVTFNNEDAIAAGSSQVYSLRATALNFTNSSVNGRDSVSTTLLGDSSHNGSDVYVVASGTGNIVQLAQDNAGTGKTDYNFIWSDYGSVSHSATPGASSNDWADGYLVTTLPLTSQALSAQ